MPVVQLLALQKGRTRPHYAQGKEDATETTDPSPHPDRGARKQNQSQKGSDATRKASA